VPRRPFMPWVLGVSLALFMTLTPLLYYRWNYTVHKRLRIVEAGKLYRSGCLTVDGFEDAVKKYGIRMFLNLQNEAPDPELPLSFLSSSIEKESAMCKRLGVRYEYLEVDLRPPNTVPPDRPEAIAKFLALVDNPDNYPMLVHCRAGLHRTGVLVALYRMEYNGWSSHQALEELRGHGFGRMNSYSPNEYIWQYVLSYEPRVRDRKTAGNLTSRPAARKE
jgi:tyrosine-protein phosphatase SIW14